MDVPSLLASLRRAVSRDPDDPVLRMHLAELLIGAGLGQEAVGHIAVLLATDPANPEYQRAMVAAVGGGAQPIGGRQPAVPTSWVGQPPAHPDSPVQDAPGASATADGEFDWGAAEQDVLGGLAHAPVQTSLRLSDVGGLERVKERIEAAFLTPLRNPQLRERFGKTLRGGLLLYGPPGCGKTHLARAVAGELGAKFIAVSLADVLSRWVGQSESNVAALFEYARGLAPCVVFFDEVDAIGHKRSGLGKSGAALRGTINQLLAELDGVGSRNEGVFVLGATNAPWDVDPALRRPGRFDRTLFVEPPDGPARRKILEVHLRGMPVEERVDLDELVRRTESFSGADLAHACQTAAEGALLAAVQSGAQDRPIRQADLLGAVGQVTPSTGRWFATARNVVLFADQSGEYQELAAYMKARRLL